MTLAIAETVVVEACRLSGFTLNALRRRSRLRRIVRVRHAIVYAIRIRTNGDYSFPKIASILHRADHTTACSAMKVAEELMPRDEAFAAFVSHLLKAPVIRAGMIEEQVERERAGRPLVLAGQIVPVPAPVAPLRLPIYTPPKRARRPAKAVVLKGDDMTLNEKRTHTNMVRGSARLAKAIIACRSASASRVTA